MAPLPKKKTPASRQAQRRSQIKLTAIALVECSQCRTPRPSHITCPNCGMYDGRQVVDVDAKAAKKKKAE
jgi:large subunit ribosomal protein L32